MFFLRKTFTGFSVHRYHYIQTMGYFMILKAWTGLAVILKACLAASGKDTEGHRSWIINDSVPVW